MALSNNKSLRVAPLAALILAASLHAQSAVWTAHYDNFRTGANTAESILRPENVTASQFGKLASVTVSGCVFAQPLYVPAVRTTSARTRNLFFVATTTNNVYAFDADDYTQYFAVSFGIPPPSSDFAFGDYHDFPDCNAGDGDGPIGIAGTPVIDVAGNAMYFVAHTIDSLDPPHRYRHLLHKISLTTGEDMVPPVEIAGSKQGVTFESRYHLQRAALLFENGRVYVAFASHQDESPYYGWMFTYGTDLKQQAVFNYSPAKTGAGIWQSGGGPASDGTSLYFVTGNLAEDVTTAEDNSDSVVQVDPISLQVRGKVSFPTEATKWDQNFDLDLGSSRAIVIPGSGKVISGSKYGDMFVINRNGMTLTNRFQAASRHSDGFDWTGIYNGFAYWNKTIFAWPGGGGFVNGTDPGYPTDTLKAWSLDTDSGSATLIANGQTDERTAGYQGGNLVISANGSDPATGIVWVLSPDSNSKTLQPGSLHAYRASGFADGLFHELWNNADSSDPDSSSYFAKFNQPLVANGKVFLPTFSRKVLIYGLQQEGQPQPVDHHPRPPIRLPEPPKRKNF